MEPLDRRKMLRMLAGNVTVPSTSIFLMADTAEVIPVSLEKNLTGKVDELIEEAQWGKWGTVRHLGRSARWALIVTVVIVPLLEILMGHSSRCYARRRDVAKPRIGGFSSPRAVSWPISLLV